MLAQLSELPTEYISFDESASCISINYYYERREDILFQNFSLNDVGESKQPDNLMFSLMHLSRQQG